MELIALAAKMTSVALDVISLTITQCAYLVMLKDAFLAIVLITVHLANQVSIFLIIDVIIACLLAQPALMAHLA